MNISSLFIKIALIIIQLEVDSMLIFKLLQTRMWISIFKYGCTYLNKPQIWILNFQRVLATNNQKFETKRWVKI